MAWILRLGATCVILTALVAGFTVSPAGAVLQGANGRIAFVSDRDGDKEIFSSRADGSGVKQLTTNTAQDYDPAFSSDGSKIAFISDQSGSAELYTMNADGTGVRRLTNNTMAESHPTWDPVSKTIAFAGLTGTDSDIYKILATGGVPVDLTPDQVAFDADPAWSPGGLYIAFDSTNRNGDPGTNVYTMENDGTSVLQLTTYGTDSNPAYSPDNKTLAFQSGRDASGPHPSFFASVSQPVGVAFTSTSMLVTQWNQDQVLAVDDQGNSSVFATLPPTGASIERYIAVSPGLGGFPAGYVYVTVRDQILRISPSGQKVKLFATIPDLPNSNNFLVFDKVGTFHYDLIVVGGQNSKIFKVDSRKNVTMVADLSGLTEETEGSDVAPLSWGPTYGGDLIVASKFDSTVYAVTPAGAVSTVGSWDGVEQAAAVPSTVCDYGLSGGAAFVAMLDTNQIMKIPASMLTGLTNQFLTPSEVSMDGTSTPIGQFVSDGNNVTISQFWPTLGAPDVEETAFAPCGGHDATATRPATASRASAPASSCPLCPHEIYKMQKDGSAQIRLTNNDTDDARPAWSADGTQITFQTDRDDPDPSSCEGTQTCENEIYTMSSVDGSGQTDISNDPGNDYASDWEGLSYPPVAVVDFAFVPSTDKPAMGTALLWDFQDNDGLNNSHTATDTTGMALFDSGEKAPGDFYVYRFFAAGRYPYDCSIHPTQMSGTVKVPMTATPKSGDQSTTFTITWASSAPPVGFVYDVQIQRPGSSGFEDWLVDQTAPTSPFVADGGSGTYSFQSRLRKTSNGAASLYSPVVSITVT